MSTVVSNSQFEHRYRKSDFCFPMVSRPYVMSKAESITVLKYFAGEILVFSLLGLGAILLFK